jgi:hypothetical protein
MIDCTNLRFEVAVHGDSNLSFWDNFDSRPPPNSKGNEFGISSGVDVLTAGGATQ